MHFALSSCNDAFQCMKENFHQELLYALQFAVRNFTAEFKKQAHSPTTTFSVVA